MRTILLAASLALAQAGAAAPAEASLPPGISGAWYNPDQPGHGLTVEILDGQRALVFWHVFDPDGDPVHLYIDGKVNGNRIEGPAFLGRGMRFGAFDRSEHQLERWGQATLDFEHCNAAGLAWRPDGPAGAGYAAGSMRVQRLTAIEGLRCDLGEPARASAGSYQGVLALPWASAVRLDLVVDGAGRLWGIPQSTYTPVPSFVGLSTYVLAGTPGPLPQSFQLVVHENLALAGQAPPAAEAIVLDLDTQADGSVRGTAMVPSGTKEATVARDPAGTDPLQRSFDVAELDGLAFVFTGLTQFFEHPGTVRFLHGGRSFCVDTHLELCAVGGSVSANDAGLAMFDLQAEAKGTRYSGKGWVYQAQGRPARLVLVATGSEGSLADAAFGIVAERAP